MTSPPVASLSTSSPLVKPLPCFCVDDMWGPLTCGAQQSVTAGVVSRVHVAISVLNVFLYSFSKIDPNFKNSYLELGVYKLSEPNFVGLIMKCTIFLGEFNQAS